MIAVTGATGQLGQLVINGLLKKMPAAEIVAAVRNTAKAADIAARGVVVRRAEYNDADSLVKAFAGVDKVLLISANEIGKRYAQHSNVINAAKAKGVKQIVYTSLLHTDVATTSLSVEHRQSEAAIRESGLSYVILRNGWYTENYTASIPAALANGAFIGCAGEGRISSAPRIDFAEAAVAALTSGDMTNRVYELGGDDAYTLADLAAEISRQTGRNIPYKNLTEQEYAAALLKAGLPEWLAKAYAEWDRDAARDEYYDASHQLSKLIGRPTTPLKDVVAWALKK